jgi:hypothetical protein
MKGVLPWLVRRVCPPATRDFGSALAALVSPEQYIFSSPYTISIPLSPSPGKLGKQSCRVVCLLVCVSGMYLCLWIHLLSRADRLRPRPAGNSVVGGRLLPRLPPAGTAPPAGVATTDRLGRLCSTLFLC